VARWRRHLHARRSRGIRRRNADRLGGRFLSWFPGSDVSRYPQDANESHWAREDFWAVSLDTVKQAFARYGLLDDRVRFLVGWFHETLPNAPIERLALMRLDADTYGLTMARCDAFTRGSLPLATSSSTTTGYPAAARRSTSTVPSTASGNHVYPSTVPSFTGSGLSLSGSEEVPFPRRDLGAAALLPEALRSYAARAQPRVQVVACQKYELAV
jgi:hypothetical protein